MFSSQMDLTDQPLPKPDGDLFPDRRSFMKNGHRMAGYPVVTAKWVVEAVALPSGTSAQKAELSALTRALQLSCGMKVNIYTDSRYAFMIVRAHGAIW